ncbi:MULTISPECIES: hypothetical protein [unclassified Microbacterium]|uniref:hypothetical protein n=1 Tax=unclassified Microbacterium TaxID=2609290 RepID=UPI00214AD071|nr:MULTISPECIES: hypothetical protein [unclassified Microbacterium]MCR2783929.1 hypothetical protein [Microbacterium sp. zg.B96]MDL5351279.1 hypothetical protein [Microbacterium sp. zg-YB36]WIM15227.1 hypothetical protein QNO11_11835 [Microbacterium sp. zg-B96]
MNTDVSALTTDMLRFAALLKQVARPGPSAAVDFIEQAEKLLADSSPETIDETRLWLSKMLQYTGDNSIFDRYVLKDGEPDTDLSREYLELAKRLRRYAYPRLLVVNPYRRKLLSS